jgi:hypothetical protein
MLIGSCCSIAIFDIYVGMYAVLALGSEATVILLLRLF